MPVPGPLDRVSFLDEQRRRRGQTWRCTVQSAVAAALFGVPLMMFLTPIAYLAAVGALRLIDGWMLVPPAAWSLLADLARFVPAFLIAAADAPHDDALAVLRHAAGSVAYPFGSLRRGGVRRVTGGYVDQC